MIAAGGALADLGVLLPHLAGVVVEDVEVSGTWRAYGLIRGRVMRHARGAAAARAGCIAGMSGGWPTPRSGGGGW